MSDQRNSEKLLSPSSQNMKKSLQLFSNKLESQKMPEPIPTSDKPTYESLEVENLRPSIIGTLVSDSRSPLEAYCIDCKKNILTVCTFHTGRSTHVMGGLLCCLGFYCCCCCLPYHMKDCKDVRHRCPYCDGIISIKKFTIF